MEVICFSEMATMRNTTDLPSFICHLRGFSHKENGLQLV